MKYPELMKLCKNCTGCNILLLPNFQGKVECKNYCKADDTSIEKCWKILRGEQMKL